MKRIKYSEVGVYYSSLKGYEEEQSFRRFVRNFIVKKVDEAYKDDSDYILLITGAERSGKSNLALVILEEYLRSHGINLVEELRNGGTEYLKQYMGIEVKDILPILRRRLSELKNKADKFAYPFIVDEGARFYSKWRQASREGYEVFLIYRLMGFLKMFWMMLYQNITDAGEIFKTGRVNMWLYTFRHKSGERYVAYIPPFHMTRLLYYALVSKRFKNKLGLAHYFPKLFFNKIVKLEDVVIFKAPKFKAWDVYEQFKIEYNKRRVEFLEQYLSEGEIPTFGELAGKRVPIAHNEDTEKANK